MMDEIIIDEDDRFIYCEKWIDGCHIRHVKDKIFPEPELPINIHELIVSSIKNISCIDNKS